MEKSLFSSFLSSFFLSFHSPKPALEISCSRQGRYSSFSFFLSSILLERLGFWGLILFLEREKERREGGREGGDMGVMCGEKGENFMILFWEKEREEEEEGRRWRG